MNFFKNHSLTFVMAVNILLASLGAKNMVSYPLGYNFSCSYGVPLAIGEVYSQDYMTHFRFITGAYQVSAIPIRDRSMLLNLFVDMIICLVVFFLLQKLPHEGGHEKRLRRWGFVLTLFLSFVLWANILSRWDDGAYRFLYLVAVLLEILLVLIAIIKGAVVCLNLMKKLRNAGFAE